MGERVIPAGGAGTDRAEPGASNVQVAEAPGTNPVPVGKWRRQFAERGLAGPSLACAAHAAAERNLFNRLLGCLHTGQHYDEKTAFPNQPASQADAA